MDNQISNMTDRELLEGIYIMLSKVLSEIHNDAKDLSINVLANVLADRMFINNK